MSTATFVVGAITPAPTADEAAAIVLAFAEIVRAGVFNTPVDSATDMTQQWVKAARLTARGGGRRRGAWRLNERSGRN